MVARVRTGKCDIFLPIWSRDFAFPHNGSFLFRKNLTFKRETPQERGKIKQQQKKKKKERKRLKSNKKKSRSQCGKTWKTIKSVLKCGKKRQSVGKKKKKRDQEMN